MPSYLITGASRGLGYGFLKALASDPSNTIIALVRNTASTKEKLTQGSLDLPNIHLVSADITDPATLKKAAAQVAKILDGKGLDVLINNAAYMSERTGLSTLADFEDDSSLFLTEMDKSLTTNVYAVLSTIYAFLPLLRQGSLKKVLAISSGQADIAFINETKLPFTVDYAISKAGLNILMAKLQHAYAQEGILFMSVCPGMVETDGLHAFDGHESAAERGPVVGGALAEYASGALAPSTAVASAKSVLKLLGESSVEGGQGGSFRSHNGTNRYL